VRRRGRPASSRGRPDNDPGVLVDGDPKPRNRATRMEFRHPSWKEARELLLSQGVAWCVAETDDKDPTANDLSW
jgi:hypothetical protein